MWLDKEINVGNTLAGPGSRKNDNRDLINRILLALDPVSSRLPIMPTFLSLLEICRFPRWKKRRAKGIF